MATCTDDWSNISYNRVGDHKDDKDGGRKEER